MGAAVYNLFACSCRFQLRHARSLDARGLHGGCERPARGARGRVVTTAKKLTADKDTRDGARARDGGESVLHVGHVSAVIELDDVRRDGDRRERTLRLGAIWARRLREDDNLGRGEKARAR